MSQRNAVSPLLRSLSRPHGFEPLRVEGRLPESLRGTLFRAGPGLFERFGASLSHAFEADGAISAVRFDGSGAQGACRIVESAGYRQEEAAGRFLFNSAAPWLDRMRAARKGIAKTTGNTSTFLWQDRLFALMEGGLLQEMDPGTLDTLEATDLGVVSTAFSAHPHRVASLRTTFNFGVRYGPKMLIDLYALSDEGSASKLGTVESPWQGMMHDFIATERHLILFVGPVKLNLLRAMLGLADFTKLFQWKPELGARLIVVPLDAIDSPRTFELDAFWTWHFANAFEEDGGPCIDLCRYPEFSLSDIGELEDSGPPPLLTRLHLDLKTGRTRETKLFDIPCEFPQLHPRLQGARHGTLFAQTERRGADRKYSGITRIELDRGSSAEWAVPAGHVPSEPVLVPRGEAEDDAFVLDLVYDGTSDHSYVAVLDGQHLEDGPVATVHFDHPIPVTFHGGFSAAR
ncbi:carotenoid oxygenase family protein [Archangium lansingense]|uniref:Carotenoid oxygenase family protein n=1 Tax=Archangium lansingense TaxID=2995310 RepID=A0ABT4A735_9BACT|nr:carotenoid oxygenase family protein [Archangium lansinium]MCY1076794.1 carotenoid oxygenase family protein [Archangium lansinium]